MKTLSIVGMKSTNGKIAAQYVSDILSDTRAGHDHLRQIREMQLTFKQARDLWASAYEQLVGYDWDYRDSYSNWQLSFHSLVRWVQFDDSFVVTADDETDYGDTVSSFVEGTR